MRKGAGKRWMAVAIVVVSTVTLMLIVTAVFIAVDGLRYRDHLENVPMYRAL